MNRTIIVKIELTSLCDTTGKLDIIKMDRLAMVLSNLHNSGKKVVIVTSGAILLGLQKLGLTEQPGSSVSKQALAAIGQAELIKKYQKAFGEYNQIVAQVLITQDVVDYEERRRNATNTFACLLEMNIIPVVNENDVVSDKDIVLQDNYPLALSVAKLANAGIILIKGKKDGHFLIIEKGNPQVMEITEQEIFNHVERFSLINSNQEIEGFFPEKIDHLLATI